MHTLIRRLAPLVLAALAGVWPVASAAQQNLFAPAVIVNESAITGYELQQRARMLTLLNAPGNPQEVARDQLIDDRLRLQAARDAGVVPSEQEILDGMAEFASRADLSREEFIAALAASGVDESTFRDFVRAGIAWRQVVGARFAGGVSVDETEVDRALSARGGGSTVRVLLSEIIMPMTPQNADQVRARAERIATLTDPGAFSAQAQRFSATATRANGGRLPWRDLSELPPALRPLVLTLRPGEVTEPLPIPDAIALFQLRDIEETGYSPPQIGAVEYAAYYIPGGRSEAALSRAAQIRASVDRCDDLYGVAQGQPPEVLERGTLPPEDIPTDIAFELSKLDPGEVSTALTRSDGQTLVFLMLCGRTPALDEEIDEGEFAVGLRNQRIAALADGYLSQLRADARIIDR